MNNSTLINTVLPSFNPSYNTLLRYLFHEHIKRDYCLHEIIPERDLSSSGTIVTQNKNKSDLTCSCHCFYFRGILLFFGILFPHEGLSIKLRLKLEWKNLSHGWNWMTQKIYWFDSLLPITSIILPLPRFPSAAFPHFPELLHQPCQAVRATACIFTGGCAFLTGREKPRSQSRNAIGSLHRPWALECIPKWPVLETYIC